MGNTGYNFQNHFPTSGPRAYDRGGSTIMNTPGPRFYTNANLGLNAARGGDAITCTGKTVNECRGDSSCTWADGNVCKNTFQSLQSNYGVSGYLEQQFQNGTMGAPYIRHQYSQQSQQPTAQQPTAQQPIAQQPTAQQPIAQQPTSEEGYNNVDIFGVKKNTAPIRENLTRTENKNRGDNNRIT